ncbi:hypothetical protein OSB04_026924 [Centaurea solstitialis]|uniref:Replication factor A C-terminal domain-containing protein n=1 Tax=Centaurea solstitialis TaxID=347529 RepID=A0AA38SDL9_9ASTR|nr:hypothetical protein OSB04_026924 [Centaurea solstitialis]
MEAEKPTTTVCTVVAIDHTSLYYTVCSFCERTLSETNTTCNHCTRNPSALPQSASGSKRLFRVLMSIATETKVFVVVLFDRAARVLFGSSAQDFIDFAKHHPFSANRLGMYFVLVAETASKILEGEMLRVTLSKPKNGNAQHQRVVSVVPLKSGFRPVMDTLREVYGVRAGC